MSKPRGHYSACGKRAYPSYVAAVEALIEHKFSGASPIRAYRCPMCVDPPTWHLTSSPKRPQSPGGAGQRPTGRDAA